MTRFVSRVLTLVLAVLIGGSAPAAGGVLLHLGDILVAEPGTASISVINPSTGARTVITQGGLLLPVNKAVGVALARDGDVIVVHRELGLIRVNPASGAQSLLSQGGLFKDPWALAIDKNTGDIYVADSGYDNDRPSINEPGKVIRVDPVSGTQTLIAVGSPCTFYPANAACQNTTSAGSYLSHPYGIAIDYTGVPGSIVVADMSSFNGQGAIIRFQPLAGGLQTLLWGPASASPAPQVGQSSPLGCPMGVAVEPNGNLLTTAFSFPIPPTPTVPPPSGTFYGCSPPGIFRVDLANNVQTVVNTNAPPWEPNRAYAVGAVIRDGGSPDSVHKVSIAGVSQTTTPNWNSTPSGSTADGTVVWQNIGHGANWLIPFGVDTEPAPTLANPSAYNVLVGDEGYSMAFRVNAQGQFLPPVPLAASVGNVTSLDVLDFTPPDGFKIEPVLSNGAPTGVLPLGTTQTTLSLTTDVNANCRVSPVPGVAYAAMPTTFSTTGLTTHATLVTGLSGGGAFNFYVRCDDGSGHVNTADYTISFSVLAPDTAAPSRFNGQPVGVLAAGTTQAIMSLSTNEAAVCRYSSQAGVTFAAMVTPFATTGGTEHSTTLAGLTNGSSYTSYVRCQDTEGNANTDDAVIAFSVAGTSATFSNFIGAESPLSEGGRWDSPGAWADLQKNAGVYAVGPSAGGRLVTPVYSEDQYSEITYGQDPGTASWVGVTTRMQGAGNGSGYLAIALSGQVRLYRTDDTGALSFVLLESASANLSAAPRRLRLESAGNVHKVFLNGTQVINHTTSGTLYTGGQPGIAASVFGGPQVRILSFEAGNLTIGSGPTTTSFSGVESPLSEAGLWDSPGTWADLHKSDGAYATGLNAASRLVTPLYTGDQYSEITYSENPGAASWVGAMTRLQGSSNGSGYLAIVFAGEVRLYRASDTGGLSFTLLAAATADLGAAPRQLRLESIGSTHRVFLNGTQVISHSVVGTPYVGGQPGIAASAFGGPQVRILSFEGGNLGAGSSLDTTAPLRFNAGPVGVLPAGTTQTIVSLTTDEVALCRYSAVAGTAYGAMTPFSTTGGTGHTTVLSGLANGVGYSFSVRCQDVIGNTNTDDAFIAFSVASPSATISNFIGAESPLSEGGRWDSAGNWADLRKDNGAYAVGVNALGRLVMPAQAAEQYAEISYDRDPGSSSWVGVMTRIQGPGNGSGYLAIAYAGEVRLYRVDDGGGLSFAFLASASAAVGSAPRRLRLQSVANTHRVYFNGLQVINHTATDALYTDGQPGMAASVFGGPQVRILSFESGNVSTGPPPTSSVFASVENPLSEGGMWDSPGAWADLQKNAGAFATGANSLARLVTPLLNADQYAEITYDQNPGAASWVGVMTRIQGAGNGSGYLAMAYGGEVRLYLADDTGSLNFTLLASISAAIEAAPRRLRLESAGNLHRVLLNGTEVISHTASGTLYTSGQPGVAASVFGGPQVRILSFDSGNLGTGTSPTTSHFTGVENPLSESLWDSPGAWADLQKNAGAFTTGLNAAGRLAAPLLAANQYAEITYDQNPGAASWVGVMTRIQGAGNGSGYLAIAYAGEVRLYRADDTGSLGFALLGAVSAAVEATPRRLRLESTGNTHRVLLNGTEVINHAASGTLYTSGQPGIAASVFGGPQVRILSFEGGQLGP